MSKDSIGFPKEIFGFSKEVNQICIRVRQMMYVDQFEVFLCQIAPSWPPNEVKHLGLACVAGIRKGRRRGTPARKPLFSPSRLLIKKNDKNNATVND